MSTRVADDPLDDPHIWREIVWRLGLNPMHSTFSIKDIAAEHGFDADFAYATFLTHFHQTFAQH
jgi:hypothetical protein